MSPKDVLTLHEAFSGILGSISLVNWIFLLVPQLILNYRMGNADGISLAFLCIWMIGDVTNLLGAIQASLVPTVVIIAIYFCATDILLIAQSLYYKLFHGGRNCTSISPSVCVPDTTNDITTAGSVNEGTSLLSVQHVLDSTNPFSRHCSEDPVPNQYVDRDENVADNSTWYQNISSLLSIILIGTLGWTLAYNLGIWKPVSVPANRSPVDKDESTGYAAQLLGYTSAVFYLTARIPQIIKNYREKSCKGLALLFFILSLIGNATYGLSIICHSLEKDYLLKNLPWLIGSLGTMAEDVIIFQQFRLYSCTEKNNHVVNTL